MARPYRMMNEETPIVFVVQSAVRAFDAHAGADIIRIDGVTLPEATRVHLNTIADDSWPDIIMQGDVLTVTGFIHHKTSRFGNSYIKVNNAVLDDLDRPAYRLQEAAG